MATKVDTPPTDPVLSKGIHEHDATDSSLEKHPDTNAGTPTKETFDDGAEAVVTLKTWIVCVVRARLLNLSHATHLRTS